MPVRPTREKLRRRRPRTGGSGRSEDAARDDRLREHRTRDKTTRDDPARDLGERRDVDPAQDTAVYTCVCGYVFEADVSTSVGCPNCGASQAW